MIMMLRFLIFSHNPSQMTLCEPELQRAFFETVTEIEFRMIASD